MTWLSLAIIAYMLTAGVAVADKYFLTRRMPSAVSYAFWVGIGGFVFAFAIPFGFNWPGAAVFWAAFFSGLALNVYLIVLFGIILKGAISRVITLVGGLIPVFTLMLAALLLGEALRREEMVAFIILVASTTLLSFSARDENGRPWLVLGGGIFAAFCMAASTILGKYVFLHHSFLSGFIWIRLLGGVTAFAMLLVPVWHNQIFATARESQRKFGLLVVIRVVAGFAFLILNYAIALGSVTLVNALKGIEFAILFIATLFLSHFYPNIVKESLERKTIALKFLAIGGVAVGLWVLAI